jgi:hypothetical protein
MKSATENVVSETIPISGPVSQISDAQLGIPSQRTRVILAVLAFALIGLGVYMMLRDRAASDAI